MYSQKIFAAILASSLALGSALNIRNSVAYYDPAKDGGAMLDAVGNGYGEPLNVIISGDSSPGVLTDDGIVNYAQAIGFSTECLGFHLGNLQSANLGDGDSWVGPTEFFRQDYNVPIVGSCTESGIGGNHFRVFRQDGPLANSGALFLAVSKEENGMANHDIVPNGYNIGRDELVVGAVGTTTYGGVFYSTVAKNIIGLLVPGSDGVNHGIAQDGIVTLLTVTII